MRTTVITIREYCDLSGYSVRNATQHINKGTLLPYVRSARKSGATWLLDVMADWYESKQASQDEIECNHRFSKIEGDKWVCTKCLKPEPF